MTTKCKPRSAHSCGWCNYHPDLPLWMSEIQLANYWSLFDENGEPLVAEIRAWSDRPADENRLSYACMGSHRRYYRPGADEWAWDEADLYEDGDLETGPTEPEGGLPN
jgi:hypothetical protein